MEDAMIYLGFGAHLGFLGSDAKLNGPAELHELEHAIEHSPLELHWSGLHPFMADKKGCTQVLLVDEETVERRKGADIGASLAIAADHLQPPSDGRIEHVCEAINNIASNHLDVNKLEFDPRLEEEYLQYHIWVTQ